MEHLFTKQIKSILKRYYKEYSDEIFDNSLLIQYINEKSRSANKGSKARASFANLYALYVLIEDYVNNKFDISGEYSKYEGALFNKLFNRQRELPFGNNLQNHALNNRLNSEFQKYFPNSELIPILRNLETKRYRVNENLLNIKVGKSSYNIAKAIIEIIDEYSKTKQESFQLFVSTCEQLQVISNDSHQRVQEFIVDLLAPNTDARLFDIVSFSILKYYFHEQTVIWGVDIDNLNTENLKLYKTGRTNANDGGIDFVMKPLGRFFQVTESLDFKKYFLDIDKIQKYPITFVIKSNEDIKLLKDRIRANAFKIYSIDAIVEKYLNCIEEIINIPILIERLLTVISQGYLNNILNEIIIQSRVEFNFIDDIPQNMN
jgi:hypothetical protein